MRKKIAIIFYFSFNKALISDFQITSCLISTLADIFFEIIFKVLKRLFLVFKRLSSEVTNA